MEAFYTDRHEQLRTIKVPTVVIHGTEDPIVVLEAGKNVATNIPGSSFEIIKGMGHYISDGLVDTLVDLIAKNAIKAKGK